MKSVYLDASVLVALHTTDAHSAAADRLILQDGRILIVTDLAIAECSSAFARRVRMGELTISAARLAFAALDSWLTNGGGRSEIASDDLIIANRFIRRLDTTLRVADAIHVAAVLRLNAALATFDVRMADAARFLGAELLES